MAAHATVLQELHLAADRLANQQTWSIDQVLHQQRPRKRKRPSKTELKQNLEAEFLTPSAAFNAPWLNELQQRWDTPTDHTELFQIAPTQTRTIIRFKREGLEGRVTGYKEITVPASSATAKNSTSLLRKPANRADFVRGAAGFFPFAPGGLDGVEAIQNIEDQALQHEGAGKSGGLERVIQPGTAGGLLEIAPGFTRGMKVKVAAGENENEKEVEKTLEEEPEPATGRTSEMVINGEDGYGSRPGEEESAEDEDIDALLPVEFPALAPRAPLAASRSQRAGKEWAHMVDINKQISNFKDLVPDMAREYPFELDIFQKEAVYHLEMGDSVFVAAHTSAGKTVVAEYAIALAAKHMTKAIYTSPIKALSNQKFRDFRNAFDDVGILTGDVQIRPEASCLIMTTEILRSMLYRGADLIRDVEFVIFDEVHYVNDLERGVVWEEVIIMLPEHVTLILLSATVPNTHEFASWVGRTKKKDIYVISTPKRPVPLEHYLWAGKNMFKIVGPDKKFIESGWKEANDAITGKDKIKPPAEKSDNRGGGNTRGGGRGQSRGGQRGGNQQRGRSSPAQAGRGNIARTGRGGGRTTAAQDRNVWMQVVQHLRKEDLLPACIFVFSKKRCEDNADSLSSLDYCTAAERSAIHMTIEKSIARLKPEDRELPQIRRIRELLSRGFAVHHGGMLPILKEVVEILFARGLVKVLFATETFAMGLNLPTRTVCFSGYRKHDGRSFRDLLPGEYTQMSGRAGRRGIDTVGTVILVLPGVDEAPPIPRLRNMILGDPTKLRSQFRLTYNMILNLLRVEALKIEEMIKRSFSEHATQALLPEHEQQVKLSEADLEKIKREPCDICDVDLEWCHKASMDFIQLTHELNVAAASIPVSKLRFQPKRLIVYKKDGIRNVGMLVDHGFNRQLRGKEFTLPVMELTSRTKRTSSDALPYLGAFGKFFAPLPRRFSDLSFKLSNIRLSDVECVTETVLKYDQPLSLLNNRAGAQRFFEQQLAPIFRSWNSYAWIELNWFKVFKNVSVRQMLEAREKAAEEAQNRTCIICPKFVQHFEMQHDEWLIRENIAQLRQLMSDQNLQLLPDYEQRVAVLKELGFVDANLRVELKGKVACEIHTADELVLTELVLENVLADYEPEEIVALLSSFVFQEKSDAVPALTAALERGKTTIEEISARINNVQVCHQVIQSGGDDKSNDDFVSNPRFQMVEVVYEWARGMSFNRITDLTDVMEGTIVRVITRLDETCREVKNAARIVGDPGLFAKMERCQEMIKRDVCATASLYM